MVRQTNIEVVIPFKRVSKMQRPSAEKPVVSPRRSARLTPKKDAVQKQSTRRANVQRSRVGILDLSDEILEEILLACVETFPFSHTSHSRHFIDKYDRDNVPWAYDGVGEKDSLAPWLAVKSYKLSYLCSVNKRFKRIADSILYRYVTVYIPGSSPSRSSPGAALTLRLLSYPDHARHLQSLHFMYPKSIVAGGASEYVNHTQTKLNSIFGRSTKTVPALAELISACPNIRNLRLEIGNMDPAAAKDVGIAIKSLPRLDKLHLHITHRTDVAAGAIFAQLVPRNRKLSSLFLVFQRLTIHREGRDIEPEVILSGVCVDRLVLAPLRSPDFIDDYELQWMLSGLAAVPKSLEVQGYYWSEGLGMYLSDKGDQISRLSLDNYDDARQPPVPPASLTYCRNLVTLHMASSPLAESVMASVPHAHLQRLSLTWWYRHVNLFEPLYSWLYLNEPKEMLEIKIKIELTGMRMGTYATDLRVLQAALQDAKSCDDWCNERGIIQKPPSFEEAVRDEIDSILELHEPLSGELLDEFMQAPLGSSSSSQDDSDSEQSEENDGSDGDADDGSTSEDTLLLIEE